MKVQAYLSFEGRCEEALEFYKKALGAQVTSLMRFKEVPDPSMCEAGTENKVMHAELRIGENAIFVSDGRCKGKPSFEGISLALSLASEAEAARTFAALSEGGQVQMPLTKTFFSPSFGMVVDRFGVTWMTVVMD